MDKKVLKFKSKIDWLIALVYIPLIASLILIWVLPYQDSFWVNIVVTSVLGLVLIFFTWAVFSSYYLLADEYIVAVNGPFKIRVFYDRIKDIKPNRSAWSSFSLSFDRVVIRCGKNNLHNYYFSPQNKELFIKELTLRVAEAKSKLKDMYKQTIQKG